MNLRLYAAGLGFALILGSLAALIGLDSCRHKAGSAAEAQAQQHVQEADSHAQAAQSIPDHSAELAQAQAEVDRLKRKLAAIPKPLAPLPAVGSDGDQAGLGTVALLQSRVDAQDELIKAQDHQIDRLKAALNDEQSRSWQWQQAFENERKARQAQEAATEAWKKAVTSSRWRGRAEGFAAGLAIGYVAGSRR